MSTPHFPANPNFNAQHSPMGAFMSFTCGHFGSGGGIGVEIGRPATQNIYVGVKHGRRTDQVPVRCLPFLKPTAGSNAAESYDVEKASQTALRPADYDAYSAADVQREYGWATDRWTTPDFIFSLFTPFGPIPEPGIDHAAMRRALLPAIIGRLEVDNRNGDTVKTAVFALDFGEPGTRLLRDRDVDHGGMPVGFAWRRHMGVLAQLEDNTAGLEVFQRWSVAEGLADANPIHMLGNAAGIVVEVPPGEKRSMLLAIGVYCDGIATTGIEGRYYYSRCYTGLIDVLETTLVEAPRLIARSAELDRELLKSGLSPDQQFMVAHATRSYYGSTQLLDVAGEPFWVVNEGEYCMMNTLDLTVDQVFWELKHNPWVVRNELEMFARYFSYRDDVQGRDGSIQPGGISFAHDMGVNNNFSPRGRSSYELARLTGCFSFMTMEELTNWVLTAACYVAKTGDTQWLTGNASILADCAESLIVRCDVSGIMAFDSTRCQGGSEITTYDSLDESLGQARRNTYIAVKTWACWVGLSMLDALLESRSLSPNMDERIQAIMSALAAAAGPDGVLPAVLEPGNPGYRSRILPVAEALVYPSYWLDCLVERGCAGRVIVMLEDALQGSMATTVRAHTLALLRDPHRRNLFPDNGIKLSSTSSNSWMSKIAIFEYVCRRVLRLHETTTDIAGILRAADSAHTKWQIEGVSGFWACSDQFIDGEAKGSRYYPRIITAALFLEEYGADKVRAATAGNLSA